MLLLLLLWCLAEVVRLDGLECDGRLDGEERLRREVDEVDELLDVLRVCEQGSIALNTHNACKRVTFVQQGDRGFRRLELR